jgi:exonuclease III
MRSERDKFAAVDLMEKEEIDVLAVQETQCRDQPQSQTVLSALGQEYVFLHSGEAYGTGFFASSSLCAVNDEDFHVFNSRITRLQLNLESGPLSVFRGDCG